MIRLTQEQERIVEAAAGGDHLKVRAFAGTGKTTTLRVLSDLALKDRRVLYLAFNKATAEEAKASFPSNVEARTAHSLAYRATVGHFGRERLGGIMQLVHELDDHRHAFEVRELRLGDPSVGPVRPLGARQASYVIARTLLRFVQSSDERPGFWHVPALFTATVREKARRDEMREVVASSARKVWEELTQEGSRLPVTHDFYLKFWAAQRPALPYDVILFDEAQDANPVMLSLVEGQKGAQRVFVGDSHQQIYSFRGALDAMGKVGGSNCPLTTSWRFGPILAAVANRILRLVGEPLPLRGAAREPGTVFDEPGLKLGTGAVLCRGNAGVIREVLWAIDEGLDAAVTGGTAEAVKLLTAAHALFTDETPNHPELRFFATWEEFLAFAATPEGSSYRPIVRLVIDYEDGIPNLCRRLTHETVPEADADIVISTAHKAKGREWSHVRLSDDFPDLVTESWEDGVRSVALREEEANLAYVATTRAKDSLNLAGYGERLGEFSGRLAGESGRSPRAEAKA